MSYETARDAAELDHLNGQMAKFATRYSNNPRSPYDRRTIILFPGGLGSALIRAKTPYQSGGQTPKFEDFWITLDLLFGGVDNVAMNGDIDSDDKFVVPNAEVKVLGVGPYDIFEDWCHQKNLDLFVFGYDWRRTPDYTIDFFFNKFLPALTAKVGPGPDPLADLTLVGHSLGGMLVKLIMSDTALASKVKRAITVGSPFYGYAGQTLRYFEGEKEFFLTAKKKMAEIIATLEGGYYLQFLDMATYNQYGPALAAVTDYPLKAYPSLDPNGDPADPYNPINNSAGVRYPPWVETGQLDPARKIVRKIAADLPSDVKKKFYNIRGVQFENGKARNDTLMAQVWSVVPPTFDPDDSNAPVPIKYPPGGPGDSTIPAWSSRLIGLETSHPDHVTTLTRNVEHMFLMELPETQNRIFEILFGAAPQAEMLRTKPRARRPVPRIDIATVDQASSFVQSLKTQRTKEEAREYLEKYRKAHTRAELETMARGILSLLVSGAARPSPEPTPRPKPKPKPKARLKAQRKPKRSARSPARQVRAKSKSGAKRTSKAKANTRSRRNRRPKGKR